MSRKITKKIIVAICLLLLAGNLAGPLSFVQGAQAETAVVTIERLSIGEGFLLQPTATTIKKGDTYADVVVRACKQAGIKYTASGSIEEGSFYLTAIENGDNGKPSIPACITKMPEIFGMTPPGADAVNDYAPALGEFSYHGMSGWQYSVNNKFPDVGMSDTTQRPKNGDVIRVQFSVYGYGADIGNDGMGEGLVLADKTKLIQKVTQVASDKVWLAASNHRQLYEKALQVLETLDATTAQVQQALAGLTGKQETSTEKPPSTEQPSTEKQTEEPSTEPSSEMPSTEQPVNSRKDKKKQVSKIIDALTHKIVQEDTNPDLNSQWHVIGLMRSGRSIPGSWTKTFYKNVRESLKQADGRLSSTKYTEYSKLALSLTSIGIDASNVAGYDMFSSLSDWEGVTRQGINGPIWALIAVDSNQNYEFIKTGNKKRTTKKRLIDEILSKELENGGFALSGTEPDADITAMAVQALAPYYEKRKDVKAAVDRSIKALGSMQTKHGGFCQYGTENAESAAQVVVALAALNRDAATDEEFIKNGKSPLDALLSYYVAGQGFSHKSGGAVNAMATEQGYYALVAYERFCAGKTFLYDMSDSHTTEKPAEQETESPVEEKTSEEKPVVQETSVQEQSEQALSGQGIAEKKRVSGKRSIEKEQAAQVLSTHESTEVISEEETEEVAMERVADDTVISTENVQQPMSGKNTAGNVWPVLFGILGACGLISGGMLFWKKKKYGVKYKYLPHVLCLAGVVFFVLSAVSTGWCKKPVNVVITETDTQSTDFEEIVTEQYETQKPEKEETKPETQESEVPETKMPEPEEQKTKPEKEEEQPQETPMEETVEASQNVCTLLVDCSVLLNHMDELSEAKAALVPSDGRLYYSTEVKVEEGDSVFSILLREMQANKIHMEYSSNPAYNSAYIEGIGNLYEFDGGELSGWMYSVNGEYPNYGCSQYTVKPNDVIEWHYTCDLGKDLGQTVESE